MDGHRRRRAARRGRGHLRQGRPKPTPSLARGKGLPRRRAFSARSRDAQPRRGPHRVNRAPGPMCPARRPSLPRSGSLHPRSRMPSRRYAGARGRQPPPHRARSAPPIATRRQTGAQLPRMRPPKWVLRARRGLRGRPRGPCKGPWRAEPRHPRAEPPPAPGQRLELTGKGCARSCRCWQRGLANTTVPSPFGIEARRSHGPGRSDARLPNTHASRGSRLVPTALPASASCDGGCDWARMDAWRLGLTRRVNTTASRGRQAVVASASRPMPREISPFPRQ